MCGFYNLTEGANQVISQSKNVSSIIKPTTNDVDIIAAIHFLHHHKKRKWLQNTYNLSKYSVQALKTFLRVPDLHNEPFTKIYNFGNSFIEDLWGMIRLHSLFIIGWKKIRVNGRCSLIFGLFVFVVNLLWIFYLFFVFFGIRSFRVKRPFRRPNPHLKVKSLL